MEKEQVIIFLIAALAIVAIVALTINANVLGLATGGEKGAPMDVTVLLNGNYVQPGDVITVGDDTNIDVSVEAHVGNSIKKVDISVFNSQTNCYEKLGSSTSVPYAITWNASQTVEVCGEGRVTFSVDAVHASGKQAQMNTVFYLRRG